MASEESINGESRLSPYTLLVERKLGIAIATGGEGLFSWGFYAAVSNGVTGFTYPEKAKCSRGAAVIE